MGVCELTVLGFCREAEPVRYICICVYISVCLYICKERDTYYEELIHTIIEAKSHDLLLAD